MAEELTEVTRDEERSVPRFLGDTERITKLLEVSSELVKEQKTLDTKDPEEVAQYAIAVLLGAVSFVPVVGPVVSALGSLLTAIFFPSKADDMWKEVLETVKEMIEERIEQEKLNTLVSELIGMQSSMDRYTRAVVNYEADPGRQDLRDEVLAQHRDTLNYVGGQVPQFQPPTHEVVSLPLFALAANMHLLLVADGVKHGKDWGYAKETVTNLRSEFDRCVGKKTFVRTPEWTRWRIEGLEAAIEAVPPIGTPAGIDALRAEHLELTRPGERSEQGETRDGPSGTDYVEWVVYYTNEGGKQAQLSEESVKYRDEQGSEGGVAGNTQKARWDYASSLVTSVLNYSDLWPYLLDGVPQDFELRNLCYGTLGRGTGNMTCLTDDEPNDRPYGRTDELHYDRQIRGVRIWGGQDLFAMQVNYGGSSDWDPVAGKPLDTLAELRLGKYEYIESVEVKYGYKVGYAKLTSSAGRTAECGHAEYTSYYGQTSDFTYKFPGYRLSYLESTQYSAADPQGIEGLVLGWRSLMEAEDRCVVDAAMQVPGTSDEFYVFSQNRYRRIQISPPAYDDEPAPEVGPGWYSIDNNWQKSLAGHTVDAVMPVPGEAYAGEFYVFSRDQFIRIKVNPGAQEEVIHDWYYIDRNWLTLAGATLDAVVQVPGTVDEFYVFSQGWYRRIQVIPGEPEKEKGPWARVDAGWKDTLAGHSVDAVMPMPGTDGEKFWVFSQNEYRKIHVSSDSSHTDTAESGWNSIADNWNTLTR
ncbi:insecticidal delta-endotoxin Cry8Ea1 family protein [Streptomyces sp. NPDC090231]|uniref:insecticidal delta-endotoxin Cry8Ea1 family protein n=1 Tax=unclassified Streptomyces TaxID=2593676 RepID=UPI0037FB3D17